MIFEFRELTRKDIPAIAEIASHMPIYFQNILEYAELLIDDPSCYYFGMFEEDMLLGLGNFRRKTTKYAWIESIRVAPNNQHKGIGTALFKHGVEKAKEENFPVVSYATDVNNHGSCNIGKKLGFQLVAEMKPLLLKLEGKNFDSRISSNLQPITIDEAFELMKIIPNPPKDEISLGWNYVPLEKKFIIEHPDIQFYAIENSLLVEYKERNMKTNQVHSLKAIIYGSEKHTKELLFEFIRRNNTQEYLFCNIEEKYEHIPKELGFENLVESEGIENKVVLWKLKLE